MTRSIKAGALAIALLGTANLGLSAAAAEPASPAIGLFAQDAAISNDFEIQESKIVLEDSTDPAVRAFARQMIADHGKAQAMLDRAGLSAGVTTRFVLDSVRQKSVDDLGLMDSPKLDQTYLADQIQAHASAAASLGAYASSGEDPLLVAYARMTLPVVLHHQAMLEAMTGTPPAF